MTTRYTHELNTEIRSISSGMIFEEEGTLEIRERQVLYVVGRAMVDSACCGMYGCCFAVVPGYVVSWKSNVNDAGIPVSTVEPVRNQSVKDRVEQALRIWKGVTQVVFW